MECSSFYSQNAVSTSSLFQKTVENSTDCHNFPSRCSSFSFPRTLVPAVLKNPPPYLSLSYPSSSFILHCYDKNDESLSTSAAYDVLGIDSNCTPAQLKAAFRAKVCYNLFCFNSSVPASFPFSLLVDWILLTLNLLMAGQGVSS